MKSDNVAHLQNDNVILLVTTMYLKMQYHDRAVARSENPGGLVVMGGENVPPLVEIGLTDLPKTGGA